MLKIRKPRNEDLSKIVEMIMYDPDTGDFFWRKRPRGASNDGDKAGGYSANGYWVITIGGIQYKAHRIAIFLTSGVYPVGVIDHIDGNTSNNKITNLRECSNDENMRNQKKHRSGIPPGVTITHKRRDGNIFRARLGQRELGFYYCILQAEMAVEMARCGEFPKNKNKRKKHIE